MLNKNLQSFQWSFEMETKTDKNSFRILTLPGAFFQQIQSNSTIFSELIH